MSILEQPIAPFSSYSKQADMRWVALLAHYGVDRCSRNWKDQLLFAVVRERWAGFTIASPGKPRMVVSPEQLGQVVRAIQSDDEIDDVFFDEGDAAVIKAIRAEVKGVKKSDSKVLEHLASHKKSRWLGVSSETLRTVYKKFKKVRAARKGLTCEQRIARRPEFCWVWSDRKIQTNIAKVMAMPVGRNPLANYITQP